MSPLLQLNATWLRNRVAELGLRQWWLAEQLGVDRRTVLRWVNGQVRSIPPARAAALAQVLACRLEDLLLHEPGRELASAEDQRAAGLALAASTLLDRLGPAGEWDVVEQLVKASAVPDLPVHVLGRLYHQLSVACWRQDKLTEATVHNQTALALAERCGDQALRADALGSQANLLLWRGDVAPALAAWREALALARWLTPRQRGALHSNLGAAWLEIGQLASARAELRQALACFETDGTPMNHSVLRAHLALLALAEGDLDAAAREAKMSQSQARQGDYRRGLALALCYWRWSPRAAARPMPRARTWPPAKPRLPSWAWRTPSTSGWPPRSGGTWATSMPPAVPASAPGTWPQTFRWNGPPPKPSWPVSKRPPCHRMSLAPSAPAR